MRRLDGKRAVVTGGASGIGEAIAARFREEGADVVVTDLHGGDLFCDVRDAGSVATAIETAAAGMGGLDTLVCNAGRPVLGAAHELAEDDWDDGLATNLRSVYLCARAAWRHLAERGGSIVSTA